MTWGRNAQLIANDCLQEKGPSGGGYGEVEEIAGTPVR